MQAPDLPPVTAGRSALPAFLSVETWAETHLETARTSAADALATARAEAEVVRAEGEAALQQDVLDGEREALRVAEDRARDRISAARKALSAWVLAAEAQADTLLGDVTKTLCEADE